MQPAELPGHEHRRIDHAEQVVVEWRVLVEPAVRKSMANRVQDRRRIELVGRPGGRPAPSDADAEQHGEDREHERQRRPIRATRRDPAGHAERRAIQATRTGHSRATRRSPTSVGAYPRSRQRHSGSDTGNRRRPGCRAAWYGLSTSHRRPERGPAAALFVFEREQMLTAFDLDLLRAEVDPLWTLQHHSPVEEDACRTVREQPDLVFAARLAVQESVPRDSRRVCARERAETFDRFRRRARIELGCGPPIPEVRPRRRPTP